MMSMKVEHVKFKSNKWKHPSAQKLYYQTKITDAKHHSDHIPTKVSRVLCRYTDNKNTKNNAFLS